MRTLIDAVSILNILVSSAHAFTVAPRSEIVGSDGDSLPIEHAILNPDDARKAKIVKVSHDRQEQATNPLPDIANINITPDQAQQLSKYYDLVTVINKAADVQTATVYRVTSIHGIRTMVKKVETFPVSTGREVWSCENKKDKDGNVTGREARWLGTPTGFFNPSHIEPDAKSSEYDEADGTKAPMNGFVRFQHFGIGTHEGEGVGHRHSHGCVRMRAADARRIMRWTLESGKNFRPTDSMFRATCDDADQKSGDELARCQADAQARTKGWQQQAQMALDEGYGVYRVKNSGGVEEVRDVKTQELVTGDLDSREGYGFGPWPVAQIPYLTQEGRINDAVMEDGYRALTIVECRDKRGGDCSLTKDKFPPKPDCPSTPDVTNAPMATAPPSTKTRVAAAPRAPKPVTPPPSAKSFLENLFGN